jgi:hypothetical protein
MFLRRFLHFVRPNILLWMATRQKRSSVQSNKTQESTQERRNYSYDFDNNNYNSGTRNVNEDNTLDNGSARVI